MTKKKVVPVLAKQKTGRKPLEGGSKTIAFTLTDAHAQKIKRWRQDLNCRSDSEALRQIIDKAAPVSVG